MLEAAGNAPDGTTEIRTTLARLAKAAKDLQALLNNGSEVHCLVSSSSSSNETKNANESEWYPIVLSLLQKAFHSDEIGQNATTQALRYLFLITHRASAMQETSPNETSGTTRTIQPSFQFTLPPWSPYNRGVYEDSKTEKRQTSSTYLFCRESIVNQLMKLDTSTLANMYADFFNKLSNKVQLLRLVPK